MKVQTLGARSMSEEQPRSTAYYYADLERLKRKEPITEQGNHVTPPPPPRLDECKATNDVVADVPIREVPPLRDRQWSLPEYHTPENTREETYSTAGTFPMPEPREKEPLLAELEVVGRLPLTQLETGAGVRRSRSWYLCCPNVPDEEISRESSWRYSSLRPVTAPPAPSQNGMAALVATVSSGHDDVAALRSERDALSRALSAERARAAAAARAHDARLAELHGVIAELVRRRAADKHAAAIPEEEVSDECESTTQPAGELDRSRTEQNDTSSALSPDLPTPQGKEDLPEDSSDTSAQDPDRVSEPPPRAATPPPPACDDSLQLSERDSELCLSTARCCQAARHGHASSAHTHTSGCSRHGSADARLCATTGRSECRQAKVASRVRLRRADDSDSNHHHSTTDEGWCCDAEAAERLALDVCAQADIREALVAASNEGGALTAAAAAWRARCARLQADCRVLQCALARATDTAHRLSCACAVQESACVALCGALRAADRALETYDVLLALAETQGGRGVGGGGGGGREAAERVACQLLARLDTEHTPGVGEPLLSPGPWLQHDTQCVSGVTWCEESEARLRGHAARLKTETVTLRNHRPPPQLFSYHDIEEGSAPVGGVGGAGGGAGADGSAAAMEAAVALQEALTAREGRLLAGASESGRRSRRRERHWLDGASETEL